MVTREGGRWYAWKHRDQPVVKRCITVLSFVGYPYPPATSSGLLMSNSEPGFLNRVIAEAREESASIVMTVAAARARAADVAEVLRALRQPVPDELVDLIGGLRGSATVDKPGAAPVTQPPVLAPTPVPREAEKAPAPAPPVPAPAPPVPAPAPPVPAPAPTRASTPQPPAPPAPPAPAPAPRVTPDAATTKEIPADLREMPGARGENPIGSRIRVARTQKEVLEALREHGTGTAAEVGKWVNIPSARSASYLRDLGEVGLVRLAGATRDASPVWEPGDGTPLPTKLAEPYASMPVAHTDVAFAAKYSIAREQWRIVEAARKFGRPFVIAEFVEITDLDFPRARIKDYLDDLAKDGKFIRRTGKWRRARGQKAGRTAVEFIAVGATATEVPADAKPEASTVDKEVAPRPLQPAPSPAAPVAPPAPDAGTVPADEPSLVPSAEMARMRDWGRKQKSSFTHHGMAEALGITRDLARRGCMELAAKGTFTRTGGTDQLPVFRHVKPSDPGAGAVIDQQRRATESGNGGSVTPLPVAGTGKKPNIRHPGVRSIINRLDQLKVPYVMTPSGHYRVQAPNGPVNISSTPSNDRTVMNDRTRLRRAGVDI